MKLLSASLTILALAVCLAPVATQADGPGNVYQRFRLPWPGDGITTRAVTTTINSASHTGGLAYAIDWDFPYNTFVAATGQGQVTVRNTNESHMSGLGLFITQAVSIDGGGTRYIMYGHLCSLGASLGQTLYQGQYVGRSGNTGSASPVPSVRCSASDPSGMHLHYQFDNSGTGLPLSSWQFGQTVPNQVSFHSASATSLPVGHASPSNNAGPGFYSFSGLNGGSPAVDSFTSGSYVARQGLNYGTTKALDPANFAPCGVSSLWVHGCDFTPWGRSAGVAQTYESPQGYQRALMRRSGFTSVYSVQRDILYAYHSWSWTLGYPLGDESGTSTVTQSFEGGSITKTTSPCQTNVYNGGGGLLQSYSGVCN